MAAVIGLRLGEGGANLDRAGYGTGSSLRDILVEMLSDITNVRTAVTNVTAKLDADAGVTDTDYASTSDPAALGTTLET